MAVYLIYHLLLLGSGDSIADAGPLTKVSTYQRANLDVVTVMSMWTLSMFHVEAPRSSCCRLLKFVDVDDGLLEVQVWCLAFSTYFQGHKQENMGICNNKNLG